MKITKINVMQNTKKKLRVLLLSVEGECVAALFNTAQIKRDGHSINTIC